MEFIAMKKVNSPLILAKNRKKTKKARNLEEVTKRIMKRYLIHINYNCKF